MYEIDESKYNHTYKSNSLFCQACLSADRKLSSIDEFIDIFKNISNDTLNITPPVYLCWECIAVLKRIKQFKARIEEAQRILAFHFVNKKKSLMKTLSRLTKAHTDHTIIITYNDVDIKHKIDIKQENEHSDDNFDHDLNTNEFNNEEIKKENVENKTVKKNKPPHYKIVCDKDTRNKVLKKKFSIKPEDLNVWLDQDRNSDFYRNFKYNCNLCIQGFNWKEKMTMHILKQHDESLGPHTCPTCGMRFPTDAALCAHAQGHHYAWECARCGFQCYTQRRMNAHISLHSAVQCAYCDAKFQDLTTFYAHYKSLHSTYVCDHCGRRCKSKGMLEKHMSRHLDTHPCSSCSRRYKSRAALRKHYAIKHSDTRPEDAYCVLCDKQYDNILVYRRHVQNSAAHAHERDQQDKKKIPCPDCGNLYSRRAYMMNHYRHVHMHQSKHYCAECDRHFLNRTRYVDHMRFNHEGVKKEKNKLCNICGRGFAANRTLMNHIRTHSGERPYECQYCAAKFTQRTSMVSHVKYIHMKSKRREQWPQ